MSAAYLRGPEVGLVAERYTGCFGKHAFPNAAIARKVAQKPGFVLEVYRCKRCNRWHVGSPTDRVPDAVVEVLVRPE